MLDKYLPEWQNTPTQTWRCRGPGGSHRLQNGWGVARRGPWWVRLPYASANKRSKTIVPSTVSVELTLILILAWKKYAGANNSVYTECGISSTRISINILLKYHPYIL